MIQYSSTKSVHLWHTATEDILQFTLFTDASPDPILITNNKGSIYYVNPAWEKLTGYAAKEAIGKNPRFLQSGKTPPHVYKNLWENLFQGKSYSTREIVNKKKNGKEFQIHATYFPIFKDGIAQFYVQMFHDITEMIDLEHQKDAFIGIASHELKTPITTLSAYTQILEKRLQNDAKNMYFVKNIRLQTKRLVSLIDDLLNVSRLDSGMLPFQPEKLDLNLLVQQVVTDFQYTIESHQIEREGSVAGVVFADKQRIEQILINLLTNAVKYSPNGDKIIVRLSNEKNKAIIAVQDFGFGIAKKDQPHVFKRFFRTKDKEKGRIKGFGLGLYISSEIAKRHKGKLWVESEAKKGSIFFLSLPMHQQ